MYLVKFISFCDIIKQLLIHEIYTIALYYWLMGLNWLEGKTTEKV